MPGSEPGQAVNRGVTRRLGYVELVAVTGEGVPSVVDPVRPGRQELPGARGRDLVGAIPRDDRTAVVAQRPQAGAQLSDCGLVTPRGDPVLCTGQRESRCWQGLNSGLGRCMR